MKTLIELDPNDCRYPFGEGPFVFCGDPQHIYLCKGKMIQSSYCREHHFMCARAPEMQAAK